MKDFSVVAGLHMNLNIKQPIILNLLYGANDNIFKGMCAGENDFQGRDPPPFATSLET